MLKCLLIRPVILPLTYSKLILFGYMTMTSCDNLSEFGNEYYPLSLKRCQDFFSRNCRCSYRTIIVDPLFFLYSCTSDTDTFDKSKSSKMTIKSCCHQSCNKTGSFYPDYSFRVTRFREFFHSIRSD